MKLPVRKQSTGRSSTAPMAHLHLHTDHSFLDGVGRSGEYAELAVAAGHTYIAITDHGGLHGLPSHRRACFAAGITPVYGCELYVAESIGLDESSDEPDTDALDRIDPAATKDYHLVALCQNQTGWANLLKLNHLSVRQGYYRRPRVTHDLVLKHSEGLVVTTACMASKFQRLAAARKTKELCQLLGDFNDAMPGRFFCEAHITDLPRQAEINEVLFASAKSVGVPIVYACDVHYACACDAERQDEMIAVNRHTPVLSPKAFRLNVRSLYYMTAPDVLAHARYVGCPLPRKELLAAIARSHEIASSCKADIYPDSKLKPPAYVSPAGDHIRAPFQFLSNIARAGLEAKLARYPNLDTSAYCARLEHELGIIGKLNLAGFFLVTLDVVRHCRSIGAFVWTRGSGCASLVAAACGITPIDPMRFGLLFERFIDPSRPSAPDFDLDIAADRRDEVAAWFCKKYGGPNGDRVARLGSLSTFGVKSALRDVIMARVPSSDSKTVSSARSDVFALLRLADAAKIDEDALARSTPSTREAEIDKALGFMREAAEAERKAELVDARTPDIRAALAMVGRVRGKATHAAGFVAAPDSLEKFVPVDRGVGGKSADIVTAWGEGQASTDISPAGLLKVDLLGLETAAVVGELSGGSINAWGLDFLEPAVLAEISSGNGAGIHQLNEPDNRLASIVKRLRPKSIDDFVAAISLYRPGSLKFIDDFVSRATGVSAVPAVHPIYDEIAESTYGVLVYQEQVMRLLNRLGDMPLRDAYGIIKAISKKDAAKISSARDGFISAATNHHGLAREEAERIFSVVVDFAGYSFNAAHAASYAVLGWITALYRSSEPLKFWKAWLSRTENQTGKTQGRERKLASMMRAAADSGVKLRPPMIGLSSDEWLIYDDHLRAPLSIIIGVGDGAAKAVFEWARSCKPKPTLSKFIEWSWANKRVVNTRALTALAHSGAFNSLVPGDPAGRTEAIVDAISELVGRKPKSPSAAAAIVSEIVLSPTHPARVTIPSVLTRAAWESQYIGFRHWYSSWRLNGRDRKAEKMLACGRIASPSERGSGYRAFVVTALRKHKDRRGRTMAFIDAHIYRGSVSRMVVFSDAWAAIAGSIRVDGAFAVKCAYDREGALLVTKSPGLLDLDAIDYDRIG